MTKKTLTDLKIQKLKKAGTYCDRDGLRLQVTVNKNTGLLRKSWVVRFTIRGGSVREMGLGSYEDVPLGDAREKALAARKLARSGVDPLSLRAPIVPASPAKPKPTFRECAEEYINRKKAGWRNEKHAAQWTSTLTTYAYPHFGDLPIDEITVDHVMAALDPIWETKTETASRVRQRIERVLAAAAVKGLRSKENPAQWSHNLEFLLAKPSEVTKVKNHPALPFEEMPAFMKVLRKHNSMGALSLEFCILTVTRTSETLLAEWREIDLDGGKWTIPAHRMKANKEHVVPIFGRTEEILRQVHRISGAGKYVFPGRKPDSPQCVTVFDAALERWGYDHITTHGFRSTFRDWAAETTDAANEVAEAMLAHTIQNKAEKAYRRRTMIDRRKALMAAWEKYCLSEGQEPANDLEGATGSAAA